MLPPRSKLECGRRMAGFLKAWVQIPACYQSPLEQIRVSGNLGQQQANQTRAFHLKRTECNCSLLKASPHQPPHCGDSPQLHGDELVSCNRRNAVQQRGLHTAFHLKIQARRLPLPQEPRSERYEQIAILCEVGLQKLLWQCGRAWLETVVWLECFPSLGMSSTTK